MKLYFHVRKLIPFKRRLALRLARIFILNENARYDFAFWATLWRDLEINVEADETKNHGRSSINKQWSDSTKKMIGSTMLVINNC